MPHTGSRMPATVRLGPILALSVSEALGRGHGVPVLLQSLLAWIIGELEPG